MTSHRFAVFVGVLLLVVADRAGAQPGATLQGTVLDRSGGVVSGAEVTVSNRAGGFTRSTRTNERGQYQISAIPASTYELTAAAAGFRTVLVDGFAFEVGRTLVHNFPLEIGERTETVRVTPDLPLIDRASPIVGHVVTEESIQDVPLNGRHFVDLGLLVPGSVAPSQTGFSTTPIRGVGALAINTGGNREEAVGFLVNGVTSNNQTFGSLMFQPPISSVQEFKVDNSTFSAEYGHVSGAVVNIVTRSGTDDLRGELHEFFRNDALDARNFFEFNSPRPHRFERNQFGGSLGGPLIRGRTFFFVSSDALRQRQGLDMNSLVPSDAERAAVSDPLIQRLVALIPRANFVDSTGTPRFVGSAAALVDMDRWTADLRQTIGQRHFVHGYFGGQRIRAVEPGSQGTSVPGFGHVSSTVRTLLTIEATQVLGGNVLHEARAGRSALRGGIVPHTQLNPAELGIRNGVDRPIGLPQLNVAGGLSFGGPAGFPQGRNDASYVLVDAISYIKGRHSLRLGGEYRAFFNENFAEGTGAFNFPSMSAFLAGTANAFNITLGKRVNHIDQRAVSAFVQDRVALLPTLSLELGLRYEWHVTPGERDNQFVVFDGGTASLLRVGVDVERIHRQNNRNFEPRLGLAWTPSRDGRMVVRASYGWAVDQPATTAVRDTAANPPFATPVTASGAIPLANAISATAPVGLAPFTVDPGFRNASLRSWNVNVQQQLGRHLAAMAGYFGSQGRNLRISRNINQPVNGIRPFASLAPSSPILPGSPLGNITQVEGTGHSSYHALWTSVSHRLSTGLQFDASYTWSKSLDTNSLNSSGFAIQNSYDIANQYGPSDFDVRHRFVLSASYHLPFTGSALTRGWQLAAIVQSQSGNPVNIVTSNSTLTGTPNSVRPDLTGPIRIIGKVDQWFDPAAFTAVDRFGHLGRNAVTGPGFHNTDLSIIKHLTMTGRVRVQLRADVFDLWNYANLGPPGNIVGSPNFGKITRTRFSTGEGGSSRQIQLAARMSF